MNKTKKKDGKVAQFFVNYSYQLFPPLLFVRRLVMSPLASCDREEVNGWTTYSFTLLDVSLIVKFCK